MSEPVTVTVYRRDHCALCEEAIETITAVAGDADIDIAIEQIDVDSDPTLRERYGDRVPVVAVDGTEQCSIRVDPTILVSALRDAV